MWEKQNQKVQIFKRTWLKPILEEPSQIFKRENQIEGSLTNKELDNTGIYSSILQQKPELLD
jgi:hypothetical protein